MLGDGLRVGNKRSSIAAVAETCHLVPFLSQFWSTKLLLLSNAPLRLKVPSDVGAKLLVKHCVVTEFILHAFLP